MLELIKQPLRYICIFLLTALSCIVLLLLVCNISQETIKENSRKSAEYLIGEEAFPLISGRLLNSRGDNYADSNLLNVIYNVDSENAFSSMIGAPYYRIEGESAQENYYETVMEEKGPNADYSRYWHGSQIFIRPLLMIMSVEAIRCTMFVVLMALTLWLVVNLIKQKQFYAAGIYVISLVAVKFWMTLVSLEYITTFLVMTVACIGVTYICKNRTMETCMRNRKLTGLFIASGVITSFLDFLTTETLTFTIPLILYLFLIKSQERQGTFRQELYRIIQWGIAWLCSYALMFLAKWGLILVTLGRDSFQNALQNAALRVSGSIYAEEAGSMGKQLSGALLRNLACLFPVTSDVSEGTIVLYTCGVLAVLGALFYLFRKDPVDVKFIGLLALIAMIPYARFVSLSNHSYIHYFFSYRAQMASVMAIFGMLIYSIQPVLCHEKQVKIVKRKTGKKQK